MLGAGLKSVCCAKILATPSVSGRQESRGKSQIEVSGVQEERRRKLNVESSQEFWL